MYPNLYFFLKDAFGIEPAGFTRYINSFGLLVAVAFIVAAFFLRSEMKRKEAQGLLTPLEEKIRVGEPATITELLFNLIFGFFVGYKIIGVFFNGDNVNPQEYIFSSEGSLPGGVILGLLFAGLKYYEKKKQVLAKPEERKIKVYPHQRVGDITVYAALAGFLGAKLFDSGSNWEFAFSQWPHLLRWTDFGNNRHIAICPFQKDRYPPSYR
jgi:phosphatidylglycerol:prolipoprotein diacylglycerol transferase